jgi:hypothetical protein
MDSRVSRGRSRRRCKKLFLLRDVFGGELGDACEVAGVNNGGVTIAVGFFFEEFSWFWLIEGGEETGETAAVDGDEF